MLLSSNDVGMKNIHEAKKNHENPSKKIKKYSYITDRNVIAVKCTARVRINETDVYPNITDRDNKIVKYNSSSVFSKYNKTI